MTYLDSILDRMFWSKIAKTATCWEWTGASNTQGYGYCSTQRITILAHRFSWEIHNGRAIPPGMVICHKCDNPWCVNPEHLFLGTAADNIADMLQKREARRGGSTPAPKNPWRAMKTDGDSCWRGHAFTADNTYTDPKGAKICRTCSRENKRRWKRDKRALGYHV